MTAFAATFSGNALVPAFALDFAGLFGLAYDLDGDIGDGLEGEGVDADFADGFWNAGPGPFQPCDGSQPCGIIVVASVPEPGTLALLGLGLLGLGVMRLPRRKMVSHGTGAADACGSERDP